MSGDTVVWVGRLVARASNCQRRLHLIDVPRTKLEFERSQSIGSCIGTSRDGNDAFRWPLSVDTHLWVDNEPDSPHRVPP